MKKISTDEARQFGEDLQLIADFAERLGVKLVKSERTMERGFYENMYFFSDGLGGYTRDGILSSLQEMNRLN